MRSGQVRFTSLELSDRKVRFYGSTALVTSRAEVSGATPAGDISGSFLYTRVYVRTSGARGRLSASRPAGFAVKASAGSGASPAAQKKPRLGNALYSHLCSHLHYFLCVIHTNVI